jgi:hypothetical protein
VYGSRIEHERRTISAKPLFLNVSPIEINQDMMLIRIVGKEA